MLKIRIHSFHPMRSREQNCHLLLAQTDNDKNERCCDWERLWLFSPSVRNKWLGPQSSNQEAYCWSIWQICLTNLNKKRNPHRELCHLTQNSQLTLRIDSLCLVTVAMSDKPSRSHATQHVLTLWKIHCGAKRKLTTTWQTRPSRLLLVWN